MPIYMNCYPLIGTVCPLQNVQISKIQVPLENCSFIFLHKYLNNSTVPRIAGFLFVTRWASVHQWSCEQVFVHKWPCVPEWASVREWPGEQCSLVARWVSVHRWASVHEWPSEQCSLVAHWVSVHRWANVHEWHGEQALWITSPVLSILVLIFHLHHRIIFCPSSNKAVIMTCRSTHRLLSMFIRGYITWS